MSYDIWTLTVISYSIPSAACWLLKVNNEVVFGSKLLQFDKYFIKRPGILTEDGFAYHLTKAGKISSSSENRSKVTVDSLRVVEMTPVRVVEIVPVRLGPAAVVEIVPTLVVEIVPVRVVEIIPDFANVGADIARTNIAHHMTDLTFFIVLLLWL